jgi:hypothetical protein
MRFLGKKVPANGYGARTKEATTSSTASATATSAPSCTATGKTPTNAAAKPLK